MLATTARDDRCADLWPIDRSKDPLDLVRCQPVRPACDQRLPTDFVAHNGRPDQLPVEHQPDGLSDLRGRQLSHLRCTTLGQLDSHSRTTVGTRTDLRSCNVGGHETWRGRNPYRRTSIGRLCPLPSRDCLSRGCTNLELGLKHSSSKSDRDATAQQHESFAHNASSSPCGRPCQAALTFSLSRRPGIGSLNACKIAPKPIRPTANRNRSRKIFPSQSNVRLQPQRLMIPLAAVGCKRWNGLLLPCGIIVPGEPAS